MSYIYLKHKWSASCGIVCVINYIRNLMGDEDPWFTLQWRYNGRDGVSNLGCFLNCLFRRRSMFPFDDVNHHKHNIREFTSSRYRIINTLKPRQNGRRFPDDIFKCIFLNERILISIKISLKFVPKCPIDNIQTLVQMMAWWRPGDKPLSESMIVVGFRRICVTNAFLSLYWRHVKVIDGNPTVF